jgi:hypothetical protein
MVINDPCGSSAANVFTVSIGSITFDHWRINLILHEISAFEIQISDQINAHFVLHFMILKSSKCPIPRSLSQLIYFYSKPFEAATTTTQMEMEISSTFPQKFQKYFLRLVFQFRVVGKEVQDGVPI